VKHEKNVDCLAEVAVLYKSMWLEDSICGSCTGVQVCGDN